MNKQHLIHTGLVLVMLVSIFGSAFAFRAYRTISIAYDTTEQLRFLVEGEETVGGVPGTQAFSADYLEAIFGTNPELLSRLKGVVHQGLSEGDRLSMGTVTAMLVTYRTSEDGTVADVATHVIGGFPMGKRKPGFHGDGYFKHLLDRDIYDSGNTIIGFLGRDLVYFAEPSIKQFQREMIDSLYTGELDFILQAIKKPYSYTLVIPNPRKLLPPQLRHHVQTLIVKGNLEQQKGNTEMIALCTNEKAAKYALNVLEDTKQASEAILKTKFGGVIETKAWGTEVSSWWAYEMVSTSESAILEQEHNIVRLSTEYGRVMVNVILKSFERMGRDLRQIRGSLEEKKDPRLVDAEMATKKGSHYWSEKHRWGPNWPIGTTADEDDGLGDELVAPLIKAKMQDVSQTGPAPGGAPGAVGASDPGVNTNPAMIDVDAGKL